MVVKPLLVLACIILGHHLMACNVTGLELDMNIAQSLTGQAAWFSLVNGPVQSFSVRWENIGSVSCLTRPRIDFFSNDTGEMVYTAWGSEEVVMPGSWEEWEMHSSLPEGEYSAVLRTYHCNEIFQEEPYLFTAPGSGPEGGVSIDSIRIYTSYLEVGVSGGDDIAVIPEEYPRGWIFQSGQADDSGVARLGFVPVDMDAAVTIRAVSSNGSSATRELSMKVPEEEPAMDWGLVISVAVLVVFLLYFSRNIIKVWRR